MRRATTGWGVLAFGRMSSQPRLRRVFLGWGVEGERQESALALSVLAAAVRSPGLGDGLVGSLLHVCMECAPHCAPGPVGQG